MHYTIVVGTSTYIPSMIAQFVAIVNSTVPMKDGSYLKGPSAAGACHGRLRAVQLASRQLPSVGLSSPTQISSANSASERAIGRRVSN